MTVLIRGKCFLLGLVPWAVANVSDLVQQRRADLAVRVDGDRQGRRQLPRRAGKPHDRTGTSVNVTRHASYVLHTICRQCRPSRWGALSNYSQCE